MNFKFIISAALLVSPSAQAQKPNDVAEYIATYKDLAIAEQQRTGVPAAIKLAQGIHESACGKSELSINAKNHFGIKCKNTWQGATYTYTDDAKDECFRKYDDAKISYADHSDFLKNNKRYASLFTLDVNDYKAWAHGLKRCGYATNPKYAQKIIELIERYDLAQFNTAKGDAPFQDYLSEPEIATTANIVPTATREMKFDPPVSKPQEQEPIYYVATKKNGKKGFYAKAGDLLLNAAYAHNIRYAKLLELNDLADEPLPADMFIYLEKKDKEGSANTYIVKENQLLIEIAQEQGMRLKELKHFNHLTANEEPAAGTVLQLKGTASRKPLLRAPMFGNSPNADFVKKDVDNTYVAGGAKPKNNVSAATSKAGEHEAAAAPKTVQPKVAQSKELAAETEDFNIADEPAVEEQIAQERVETASITHTIDDADEDDQQDDIQEEPMSELDRLKAKLDKSVYGSKNNTQAPAAKPTVQVTHNTTQTYQTRPAAAYASSNTANTKSGEASPQMLSGGQESLKRKIEAYQNSKGSRANDLSYESPKPARAAESRPQVKSNAATHVVKRGETAYSIANQYGLSVSELIKLNKLPGSGTVQLGQTLKVK
jgi:LysM repeat protein